jgi:hypothetical protein
VTIGQHKSGYQEVPCNASTEEQIKYLHDHPDDFQPRYAISAEMRGDLRLVEMQNARTDRPVLAPAFWDANPSCYVAEERTEPRA